MNSYKILNKQIYKKGEYSIVPIRYEDRVNIMEWRNEQIFHLRQSAPLTIKDQESYFEKVVSQLFIQNNPNQILFSYLKNDICIGYGGLVHINWVDRHAEISFIMQTSLERDFFYFHWATYLNLIESVGFCELGLQKLFTYAFDVRPHLYDVLEDNGFVREAILKNHCYFNGKMKDVLIHSKWNTSLRLEPIDEDDLQTTFEWANDALVRRYSFNKSDISFEGHKNWFLEKLSNTYCDYWVLREGVKDLGSIRIDYNLDFTAGTISYLIDPKYHGMGLGTKIIQLLERIILEQQKITSDFLLIGYVVFDNLPSISIFRKLGYKEVAEKDNTLKFTKKIK